MALIVKILLGIFGLSLLVFIHELGHYIAARLMNIDVDTFSIGFGKKLFSFKKGNTEYCISLIPLGGYCKMKGEKQLMVAMEENKDRIPYEENSYYSAKPIKRIFVAISGPLANFLFAIVAFFVVGMINIPIENITSQIRLNSNYTGEVYPADVVGLQDGDKIISVDGLPIGSFNDLYTEIAIYGNKTVEIEWLRDGVKMSSLITPFLNKENGAYYIGVVPDLPAYFFEINKNSLAYEMGVREGDFIKSLNGQNVEIKRDLELAFDTTSNEQVIEVQTANGLLEIAVPTSEFNEMGTLFEYWLEDSPRLSFFQNINFAFSETVETFIRTVKGIGMLFKGISLQNNLSGPLRVIYYTGEYGFGGFSSGVSEGFKYLFEFFGFISIALCFMNLLPIAVLDGGQIILFLVEMIIRRPLKLKTIMRYQTIGTLFMFALLIFATSNDILSFLK